MDEEREAPETEQKKEIKKHSGKTVARRVLAAAVTILLIAAAVLAYIYRDKLSSDSLRSAFGHTEEREAGGEPFAYENGASQTFARMGSGFAVASASGVAVLDDSGTEVFKQVTGMEMPAIAAGEKLALFYDVGGETCKAVDEEGVCTDLDVGESVISGAVSESGYCTVISEENGSKGIVQVFNGDRQLVYKWYSGTGYPLRAQVSPDGRSLAVLCVDAEGSVLHFFRLSSETELAVVRFDGELLFDLCYMSNDRVSVIGEAGIYFAKPDGTLAGEYNFAGRYLEAYDFGSSAFAAVYLSNYRTGSDGGWLLTLDGDGKLLGSAELSSDVVALSAEGRQVLAATADSIRLYSQTLQVQKQADLLFTAKDAFLRSRGDVLLLSSYSAEIFDF